MSLPSCRAPPLRPCASPVALHTATHFTLSLILSLTLSLTLQLALSLTLHRALSPTLQLTLQLTLCRTLQLILGLPPAPQGEVLAGIATDVVYGPALLEAADLPLLRHLVWDSPLLLPSSPAQLEARPHLSALPALPTNLDEVAALVGSMNGRSALSLFGERWVVSRHEAQVRARRVLECTSRLHNHRHVVSRKTPTDIKRLLGWILEKLTLPSTPSPSSTSLPPTPSSLPPWLVSEKLRYRRLQARVEHDVRRALRKLKASEVLPMADRSLSEDLALGILPSEWTKISPAHLAGSLGAWVEELRERLAYMQELEGGVPEVLWLPGLFDPQVYLDALRHEHAARLELPPESWHAVELLVTASGSSLSRLDDGGQLVSSLFLDGGELDEENGVVHAAQSGHQPAALPAVRLVPYLSFPQDGHPPVPFLDATPTSALSLTPKGAAPCGIHLYWTQSRGGVLSADGRRHTNWVAKLFAAAELQPSGETAFLLSGQRHLLLTD